MNPIDLDDLPHYNPWCREALTNGAIGWKTESSYLQFSRRYQDYLDSGLKDFERVRKMETAGPGHEVAMSKNGRLYATSFSEANEASVSYLLRCLLGEALLTQSVVDLGCGYGYLLHRLQQRTNGKAIQYCGGELIASGVELGRKLGMDIQFFDFYGDTCNPLQLVSRPTVVTTSYALHQLTSAEPAVELLAKYREKIARVVCLEPEEDHFGEGLLGLLRRRYGQVRGYSADLLRVLNKRDDVEIEVIEPAAIGANALLPGTLTVWSFK